MNLLIKTYYFIKSYKFINKNPVFIKTYKFINKNILFYENL